MTSFSYYKIVLHIFFPFMKRIQHFTFFVSVSDRYYARGMIHNKFSSHSPRLSPGQYSLIVQNRGLKRQSFHFFVSKTYVYDRPPFCWVDHKASVVDNSNISGWLDNRCHIHHQSQHFQAEELSQCHLRLHTSIHKTAGQPSNDPKTPSQAFLDKVTTVMY